MMAFTTTTGARYQLPPLARMKLRHICRIEYHSFNSVSFVQLQCQPSIDTVSKQMISLSLSRLRERHVLE